MKRANLKAVPAGEPDKLTYEQIDRLARSLAFALMQEPEAAKTVLLLMYEIELYPFDNSHVGTIAHLINSHLFAGLVESDEAFRRLMKKERARFEGKGAVDA